MTEGGLQFSSFQFRSRSGVNPDTIVVTGMGHGITLSSTPWLSVSGAGSQSYLLSFLVTPLLPADSISGFSVLLGANAAGTRGDARLTGIVMGVNSLVAEVTGQRSQLQADTSFASKPWVAAGLYLSLTGAGPGDMAKAQMADIQFQMSAPEPSTLVLTGGVAGLVFLLRIRKNRRQMADALRSSTLP